MENFKKELKKKLILKIIMCVVFWVIGISLIILSKVEVLTTVLFDFNELTPASFAIGAGSVFTFDIIRSKKAFKNENKLKELYIQNTDERIVMIDRYVSYLTMRLILFILLLGTIVFAYINMTICYTLVCVLAIALIIQIITDIYYRKKY